LNVLHAATTTLRLGATALLRGYLREPHKA
jgi:hypothetical protein